MYTEIRIVDRWMISLVTYDEDSKFRGKFFAGRSTGIHWCDIRGKFCEEHEYLHKDGVARFSLKDGEEWSGYFDSEEEIEAAIDKSMNQRSKD